MHCAWLRSSFVRVLKFLQIKEGGPNLFGEPILQNVWIIWSSLLYLNFKIFMEPNSSWFIRAQCILHDWGVLFSEPWNFFKLMRGDLICGGNQFCRMSELFARPFLYFNFKSFVDPNSWSLIRFQCTLHDAGVLFSDSWNF